MGQNFIRSPFQDCKLLNLFNNFCHPNNWSKSIVFCLKFILKLLKKHVTGTNFCKKAGNTKIIKSLNQFNNSCYLRTLFDLKMEDIVQASNQRDNEKCGTKFYKNSDWRLGNYWTDSIIFAIGITR